MRALVTGGCGFVGTAIVDMLLRRGNQVLNLDKLTATANPCALGEWEGSARYEIIPTDICNLSEVLAQFETFQPDCIVHAAAEMGSPGVPAGSAQFMQTNFVGTYTMLEAARHWWAGRRGDHRFLHISTDEVFGGTGPDAALQSSYAPDTPFAASKAAADHLVRAWGETYGLPVLTTHSASNYGPWQLPPNLVPRVITDGVEGKNLALDAAAHVAQDWLHVADHADAVRSVLEYGSEGESYQVGGANLQPNAEVAHLICGELDRRLPEGAPHSRMITQADGSHAKHPRTALDTTRIWRDLRWRPEREFRAGLSDTVDWYLENRPWWQKIRTHRRPATHRSMEAA